MKIIKKILKWIIKNKEWLLSGIGVLILTSLGALFYNKHEIEQPKKIQQIIERQTDSKNSSVNVQLQGQAGNIIIHSKTNNTINSSEPPPQYHEKQERVRLLSLLYNRTSCRDTLVETMCPHSASLRVREESVFSFTELERAVNNKGNLDNIDLSGANLTGIDLSGFSLKDANFRGTNFTKSDLSNTDLSGAILNEAILDFSCLDNAKLIRASLKRTRFKPQIGNSMGRGHASKIGVHLTCADLSFADFTDADLQYAVLSGAYLIRTNFTAANLSNAILQNAKFTDVQKFGISNAWRMQPIWSNSICPSGKNSDEIGGTCE
jgi:uncharacterized protein YjbI with pentapeptide repeats